MSVLNFAGAAPGADGASSGHPAAAHLPIVSREEGRIGWFSTGRRKIGLCGFAGGSRARIPLDHDDWILVGLNQLYRHLPRLDVTFDVHLDWRSGNVEGTDHEGWLAQCGIPAVMIEVEPTIPTSVRNPRARLDAHFGTGYATSTVAHMLRLILFEIDQDVDLRLRATEFSGSLAKARDVVRETYGTYRIGLFGIDLICGTEYEFQRQCVEFWIGEAEARGIVVEIPPESALLKQAYCYGYETEPEGHPFRKSEHVERRDALVAKRATLEARAASLRAEAQELTGAIKEEELLLEVAELRNRGGAVPLPTKGI